MPVLKEQLANVEAEISRLEEERRQIYKESLDAPKDEKVCEDFLAEDLAEPPLFPQMKFPINVAAINWVESTSRSRKCKLVAIRPVDESKTYIGIYVGDLPLGATATYHRESGILSIEKTHYNPAIVVPDLRRVIMGCESWWCEIESTEDLRSITDEDIDSTWYMKVLKSLAQPE